MGAKKPWKKTGTAPSRKPLPPEAKEAWRKANHAHGRDPKAIRQDADEHLMRKSAYRKERGFGGWYVTRKGVARAYPHGRRKGRDLET